MKKIITTLLTIVLFSGCSSEKVDDTLKPKIVQNSTLNFTLKDQFEKIHKIDATTKKVIFAFSKKSAHTCNDYFKTQEPNYLQKNNTLFVADVSAAPSLIRTLFIMPGLKDFKHKVILLDNKTVAAAYRKGLDREKIIVVSLKNRVITKIQAITTQAELIAEITKP